MQLAKVGVTVGVFALCGVSGAMWIQSDEPVPTQRLIDNVTEYVKKNPKDAHGHYVLGRVHSLAFAQESDEVKVVPADSKYADKKYKGLPLFPAYGSVQVERVKKDKTLSAKALENLRQSVAQYQYATLRDDKNALYFLGYGWMLEQGAPFTVQAGVPFSVPKARQIIGQQKLQDAALADLKSKDAAKRTRAFHTLKKNPAPVARRLAEMAADAK